MIGNTSTLTIEITAERPWTHAHQREALAYLLTLARDGVLATEAADVLDDDFIGHTWPDVVDEDAFTVALALYEADPVVALRWVRDLAEGRKERVIFWGVRDQDGGPLYYCGFDRARAREEGRFTFKRTPAARMVRVTRTQRKAKASRR